MPAVTTAIAAAAGAPLLLGAGAAGWTTYTVREGDTVWDIAASHRTDVRTLIRANHLSEGGHLIRAGATLRVPAAKTAKRAEAKAASAPKARTGRYRVQSGDTISGIAVRLHVSPGTLLQLNHLDSRGRIYAGQHLAVPAAAARTQVKQATAKVAGPATTSYTVRDGDTLSAIATHHGVALATMLKTNHLTPRSVIFPGQRLRLPVKAKFSQNTFAGRTYAPSIVSAADANRRTLAGRPVPSREATRALIVSTARRYGVDPALALAVAAQESGWNQRRVSVANAIGVMQVIPASGLWASDLVGRRLDLLSTQDNVTAGVVILKSLLRSAPDRDRAIAGYYQGLSSVTRKGMFADTKAYVRNINALTRRLG